LSKIMMQTIVPGSTVFHKEESLINWGTLVMTLLNPNLRLAPFVLL
jgi:hypothetical protein